MQPEPSREEVPDAAGPDDDAKQGETDEEFAARITGRSSKFFSESTGVRPGRRSLLTFPQARQLPRRSQLLRA